MSNNKTQDQKKLAPPPPVVTDIDQRIKKLEEKGRRRGRRNSWIGIISSVIITVVVFVSGYYLLKEINIITDKVEINSANLNITVDDTEGICNNECCLASLRKIKRNNLLKIDELSICPNGYIINKLECKGSLSWCEQEKKVNRLIPAEDIDEDGLSDDKEKLYGSDPENPDSDNDGFSDGEEVGSGFNPVGGGKL